MTGTWLRKKHLIMNGPLSSALYRGGRKSLRSSRLENTCVKRNLLSAIAVAIDSGEWLQDFDGLSFQPLARACLTLMEIEGVKHTRLFSWTCCVDYGTKGCSGRRYKDFSGGENSLYSG